MLKTIKKCLFFGLVSITIFAFDNPTIVIDFRDIYETDPNIDQDFIRSFYNNGSSHGVTRDRLANFLPITKNQNLLYLTHDVLFLVQPQIDPDIKYRNLIIIGGYAGNLYQYMGIKDLDKSINVFDELEVVNILKSEQEANLFSSIKNIILVDSKEHNQTNALKKKNIDKKSIVINGNHYLYTWANAFNAITKKPIDIAHFQLHTSILQPYTSKVEKKLHELFTNTLSFLDQEEKTPQALASFETFQRLSSGDSSFVDYLTINIEGEAILHFTKDDNKVIVYPESNKSKLNSLILALKNIDPYNTYEANKALALEFKENWEELLPLYFEAMGTQDLEINIKIREIFDTVLNSDSFDDREHRELFHKQYTGLLVQALKTDQDYSADLLSLIGHEIQPTANIVTSIFDATQNSQNATIIEMRKRMMRFLPSSFQSEIGKESFNNLKRLQRLSEEAIGLNPRFDNLISPEEMQKYNLHADSKSQDKKFILKMKAYEALKNIKPVNLTATEIQELTDGTYLTSIRYSKSLLARLEEEAPDKYKLALERQEIASKINEEISNILMNIPSERIDELNNQINRERQLINQEMATIVSTFGPEILDGSSMSEVPSSIQSRWERIDQLYYGLQELHYHRNQDED